MQKDVLSTIRPEFRQDMFEYGAMRAEAERDTEESHLENTSTVFLELTVDKVCQEEAPGYLKKIPHYDIRSLFSTSDITLKFIGCGAEGIGIAISLSNFAERVFIKLFYGNNTPISNSLYRSLLDTHKANQDEQIFAEVKNAVSDGMIVQNNPTRPYQQANAFMFIEKECDDLGQITPRFLGVLTFKGKPVGYVQQFIVGESGGLFTSPEMLKVEKSLKERRVQFDHERPNVLTDTDAQRIYFIDLISAPLLDDEGQIMNDDEKKKANLEKLRWEIIKRISLQEVSIETKGIVQLVEIIKTELLESGFVTNEDVQDSLDYIFFTQSNRALKRAYYALR